MNESGRIKVFFFGAIADAAGTREVELPIDQYTTAESLLDRLCRTYPMLNNRKLLIAVNEKYEDSNHTLKGGDQIAVFTPVSGG